MSKNSSINLVIEYNNQKVNQSVLPYYTISDLKKRIKNLFFPIPKSFVLTYKNKIIGGNEDQKIGEIFSNKSIVMLKVLPHSKLPMINSKSIDLSKLELKLKKKRALSKNTSMIQSCKNCENNYKISFYCRKCEEFVCDFCRRNYHSKHNCISIDVSNLNESLKFYAMTLQSEINDSKSTLRSYLNKFKDSNFIEANVRYEMILRSLNDIMEEYRKMDEITKLGEENRNKIENIISKFTNKSSKISNDLDELISELYGHSDFTSFEEIKKKFNEINSKEKQMEEESKEALSYKVSYEIANSMDKFYNKLEEIIDDMKQSKPPLKISYKSYYFYEGLKQENSEEEKNEIGRRYQTVQNSPNKNKGATSRNVLNDKNSKTAKKSQRPNLKKENKENLFLPYINTDPSLPGKKGKKSKRKKKVEEITKEEEDVEEDKELSMDLNDEDDITSKVKSKKTGTYEASANKEIVKPKESKKEIVVKDSKTNSIYNDFDEMASKKVGSEGNENYDDIMAGSNENYSQNSASNEEYSNEEEDMEV
ncbi:MAG: B-box zinc finger protein [archaeon]|nr:B-box zinc finger protein [archaeon]